MSMTLNNNISVTDYNMNISLVNPNDIEKPTSYLQVKYSFNFYTIIHAPINTIIMSQFIFH